ncbi:MAG: proteasome accessory factor PafA2 family protein [Planctomycetes bacterium]|nr:proteasome accessory factor PafA2 family protein [Planctomycetota bacterium]
MNRRIFGLETEVAIQFTPAAPGGRVPTRREIFDLLEEVLGSRYRWLRSRQSKKGIFLENGALFHYEAQVHVFSQGLVEVSTPECSDPWEAACYHAACARILTEALPQLRARLADRGYPGEVSFTKNATDKKGNFYGSHENYYVDDPVTGLRKLLLYGCFPVFLLCHAALFAAIFLPFFIFLLFLLVGLALYFPTSILRHLPVVGVLFERFASLLEGVGRALSRIDQDVILRYWGTYSKYLLYPFVTLYSLFLRNMVFVRIQRDLTPFLVTRPILTGAGAFGFEGQATGFRLSQKAAAIRRVCRIFWDDHLRPIYDIKTFLREPFSVLRPRKRLHILFSDSNMSDVATYLKLGLTGLVLEMLEAGVRFDPVRLRDPIGALHQVNDDPTLGARLTLRAGGDLSPVEVQRFYLTQAQEFFREPSARTADLLRRWSACLDALEENPRLLYHDLDWVAKLDLIDEALGERAAWRKLSFLAPVFEALAARLDVGALAGRSDDEVLRALEAALEPAAPARKAATSRAAQARPPARQSSGPVSPGSGPVDAGSLRTLLGTAGIAPGELPRLAVAYWSAHKIDLRYHELDPATGYHHQLAAGGLMDRLFDEPALAAAAAEPPSSTRAAVRASVIRFCREREVEATIDWDRAVLAGPPRRRIRFEDPFQTKIELG